MTWIKMKYYYFFRWVGGFCEIIDGIFRIITLGFWSPCLSFKLVIYSSKKFIKRKINETT